MLHPLVISELRDGKTRLDISVAFLMGLGGKIIVVYKKEKEILLLSMLDAIEFKAGSIPLSTTEWGAMWDEN